MTSGPQGQMCLNSFEEKDSWGGVKKYIEIKEDSNSNSIITECEPESKIVKMENIVSKAKVHAHAYQVRRNECHHMISLM